MELDGRSLRVGGAEKAGATGKVGPPREAQGSGQLRGAQGAGQSELETRSEGQEAASRRPWELVPRLLRRTGQSLV